VLLSVVTWSDVVHIERTTAVKIHYLEGLFDKCFSALVHWTHDLSEEFVVNDLSVPIGVECVEDCLDFQWVVRDTVVFERLCEFFVVKEA